MPNQSRHREASRKYHDIPTKNTAGRTEIHRCWNILRRLGQHVVGGWELLFMPWPTCRNHREELWTQKQQDDFYVFSQIWSILLRWHSVVVLVNQKHWRISVGVTGEGPHFKLSQLQAHCLWPAIEIRAFSVMRASCQWADILDPQSLHIYVGTVSLDSQGIFIYVTWYFDLARDRPLTSRWSV